MEQNFILIIGIITASIFNLAKDKYKKYGSITQLLVQPFWIYATWKNKQYGMFILTMYYTFISFIAVIKIIRNYINERK